ncbi:MAG: adenylate/guanylate cyclase domain-containing protein [Hyphomicrobiaceae bacterium]
MTKSHAVEVWLIDGARSAPSPQDVLRELCERLVACEVPIERAAVFVKTLHPMVMGRSFTWRSDTGVKVAEAPVGFDDSETYRASPVAAVVVSRTVVRRRLGEASAPRDFPVLDELASEGITDYIALPLLFGSGEVHVATFSTMAPGGFSEDDISGLEAVIVPLTRIAEIWALRRVATNLLSTYVGRQAGAKVLAGKILRGDAERIEAVIWMTDIRNSTQLADRMAPPDFVTLLNRFFDAQVPAITANGGEVLKYIGDGLLAIFPTGSDRPAYAACASAASAATTARSQLAADLPELGFGIALHFGEILYGNIGSGDRLDFTCIGPAVNLSARLEKLTAVTGRSVLASATVAGHHPAAFEPLGDFELPGFARNQHVYALRDGIPAAPTVVSSL